MKAPRYLGIMYEKGYGVPVDYAKAFGYYTEAAENGDITGSQLLGSLYERGLGTMQDYTKAFEWYTKAAARGDHVAAPGMRALASLYERGLGTPKDSAKAAELRRKADEAEYASDGVQSVTAISEVFGDGPQLGQKSDKPATAVTLTASLIQHFVVMETDGTSYTGWSEYKTSSRTVNLVVQDFKQFVYHDPAHPEEPLMYNLYVFRQIMMRPKNIRSFSLCMTQVW